MNNVVFVDLINNISDKHGIMALSSILNKTHKPFFVYGRRHSGIINTIINIRPQLVLYSAYSYNIEAYKTFDKLLKSKTKVISIIGGPGPTFDSSPLVDSSIDFTCVGEGEIALERFITNNYTSALNITRPGGAKSIKQLAPFVNLDSMPFPDRALIYNVDSVLRNNPSKQFFSGRGCPYQCTYCFNHAYNEMFKNCGPVIRKKSVAYLIEEILAVRNKYPLRTVYFGDDTFILNKKWLLEFLSVFPCKIDLPFTCNIRANLIDEDIVRALKESRCSAINWSIESGDSTLRNQVIKRNISDEQILKTASLLNKYKIRHRIGNLLGIPGESTEQMLKTIELNIKAKPYLGLANILVPYPGLEITKFATSHGFFNSPASANLPNNYFTKSVMENYTRSEQKFIYNLMCLFPIFTKFPRIYSIKVIRNTLLGLPKVILRPIYEGFYGFHMFHMYIKNASLAFIVKLSLRYIEAIFK